MTYATQCRMLALPSTNPMHRLHQDKMLWTTCMRVATGVCLYSLPLFRCMMAWSQYLPSSAPAAAPPLQHSTKLPQASSSAPACSAATPRTETRTTIAAAAATTRIPPTVRAVPLRSLSSSPFFAAAPRSKAAPLVPKLQRGNVRRQEQQAHPRISALGAGFVGVTGTRVQLQEKGRS
jgi:cell wall-associated NlpC family hydrolase